MKISRLKIWIPFLLLCVFTSNAQTLRAIKEDLNVDNFSIQNVKITFDSSAFIFHNKNSILKKYDYGEIRKIGYSSVPVKLLDNYQDQQCDINIYQNNIDQNILVKLQSIWDENSYMQVYDVTGKVVREMWLGNLSVGEHSFLVDISNLNHGFYLLSIMGDYSQKRTTFIKK